MVCQLLKWLWSFSLLANSSNIGETSSSDKVSRREEIMFSTTTAVPQSMERKQNLSIGTQKGDDGSKK
ncbi:hypothetical protein V6Z12_A08G163700 [Gossypium hirsutum]